MLSFFLKLFDIKSKKNLIAFLLLVFAFGGFLIFTVEYIRPLVPGEVISQNKVIGYSYYHGYPLYFDYIIYSLSILFPSVIFIFIKRLDK